MAHIPSYPPVQCQQPKQDWQDQTSAEEDGIHSEYMFRFQAPPHNITFQGLLAPYTIFILIWQEDPFLSPKHYKDPWKLKLHLLCN